MMTDKQLIVFSLNKQDFAIDVLESREIIKADNITVIPDMPEFIEGVIQLREDIVPIVNLAKRFSLKADHEKIYDQVIIVSIDERLIGIRVSDIKGIVRVKVDNIDNIPEIIRNINRDYIKGVAKLEDGLLVILDISKVFSRNEINLLQKIE
jgi:purine-binding chemotaxis protein CheW